MSNFSFLEKQFPLLAELGEKAEQYLYTDPNTTMFKLRSLGEKMVELMFQYDNLISSKLINFTSNGAPLSASMMPA